MLRKFNVSPAITTHSIWVASLFFAALALTAMGPVEGFAQGVTGYTVTKLSPSEFAATNATSAGQNFFLLLTPNGLQVQSAVQDGGTSLSIQGSNGTSVIGPFSVPAGSAVTLQVSEKGQATGSETFALLTQSQLSRASALSLSSTPDSVGGGALRSAVAAPNVSRDNQPIDFLVSLNAPAMIDLSLFTLAGEKVYGAQTQGDVGLNKLVWNLSDFTGGRVASGLYLYYLRTIAANGAAESRVGKILVVK